MEEKVIKRSPKKIIWNALFGLTSVLFFLTTSLLSPFVLAKGNQTSYDKSVINTACPLLCWSSCLSDIQAVKFR